MPAHRRLGEHPGNPEDADADHDGRAPNDGKNQGRMSPSSEGIGLSLRGIGSILGTCVE